MQLGLKGGSYEQSVNFADVQRRVIHKGILTTILTALGWFLIPIAWYLVFTLVLVFADLYTGWKASNMRFISRGIRRTIDKVVMYYIAILLAHAFDLIYPCPAIAAVIRHLNQTIVRAYVDEPFLQR